MNSDISPKLGALALARSLFPHVETQDDLDEFLLYPPDLFAFTSLIFSVTGAYRLIVSPPREISHALKLKAGEVWMPEKNENNKHYWEFDEDSGNDIKDVGGLINQLFDEKHEISKVFRQKVTARSRDLIKTLNETYQQYQETDVAFIKKLNDQKLHGHEFELQRKDLKLKVSRVLNAIGDLYQVYLKFKETLNETNLSDEFWEVLEQRKEFGKKTEIDEKKKIIKKFNRLLLEAVYPNEIEPSSPWDRRVRKVGLEWRKNLGQFDVDKFDKLKNRNDINDIETRIEDLREFRSLMKELKTLESLPGPEKDRIAKINKTLSATARRFKTNVDSLARTCPNKLSRSVLEREKRIELRREMISKSLESYPPQTLLKYWTTFKGRIDRLGKGNIWDLLCEQEDEKDRTDHWQRFVALVSIHAIADEACAGWGIRKALQVPKDGLVENEKSKVQEYAEKLLGESGTMATISYDRCRILPKRHTAEVGITLRSVSCNLAYHRSSVKVNWKLPHDKNPMVISKPKINSLNVLLLPIPLNIHTTDFKKRDVPVKSHPQSQDFFEYNPKVFGRDVGPGELGPSPRGARDEFKKRIIEILRKAREEVGRVDLVVLPETAIRQELVELFEQALLEEKVAIPITAYIAGVREPGEELRFSKNAVYFKISEKNRSGAWLFNPAQQKEEKYLETLKRKSRNDQREKRKIEGKLIKIRKEYAQYKHHRWKLEQSQLVQYQLGGALSPTKVWWEAIKIGNREVNFFNIGELLTVCPLICEDLARQDPIADLIRTVGPTLVVSILMDGPQLLERWAAKYASVLGDDPGSAVITLTSYGMVSRSSADGCPPSRMIALWSSPSAKVEIELEEGAEAVLLSLSVDERKEKAADGREDIGGTPSLSLGGTRQIRLDNFEDAKRIFKC
jgi:hypothetical protein